jgi:hypothetical protein
VLINLPHHGWEDGHSIEASLKFGALGFASLAEMQLGLVEGLHKLVGQEVVENQARPIAWDWELENWGNMNGAVGSIRMALQSQAAAVWQDWQKNHGVGVHCLEGLVVLVFRRPKTQ